MEEVLYDWRWLLCGLSRWLPGLSAWLGREKERKKERKKTYKKKKLRRRWDEVVWRVPSNEGRSDWHILSAGGDSLVGGFRSWSFPIFFSSPVQKLPSKGLRITSSNNWTALMVPGRYPFLGTFVFSWMPALHPIIYQYNDFRVHFFVLSRNRIFKKKLSHKAIPVCLWQVRQYGLGSDWPESQ